MARGEVHATKVSIDAAKEKSTDRSSRALPAPTRIFRAPAAKISGKRMKKHTSPWCAGVREKTGARERNRRSGVRPVCVFSLNLRLRRRPTESVFRAPRGALFPSRPHNFTSIVRRSNPIAHAPDAWGRSASV